VREEPFRRTGLSLRGVAEQAHDRRAIRGGASRAGETAATQTPIPLLLTC
jgi:hypothetical protein